MPERTSITSVVAILIVVSCMALLFVITMFGVPTDDTTRTQIIQGVIGLLMMVGGFFFGASKQQSQTINADTITKVEQPKQDTDGK